MNRPPLKKNNLLGSILLVAGCCLGAGMIGLPVMSATAGFIPSTVAMILAYLFATSTGLLVLEATLWFEDKVNLITLADKTLGAIGKIITWVLFLFLFYCLFVAYIDGGGELFSNFLSLIFNRQIPRVGGILVCVSLIAFIVYYGKTLIPHFTKIFLSGLAFSYVALLTFGFPHINKELLLFTHWKAAIPAIPVLLICFGYQNFIPTLTDYANRNISVLKKAIYIGNLIPFIIYFIWNMVILGILPSPNSEAFTLVMNQSNMVTSLLEKASGAESVLIFANLFAFCAILMPFMVNTLAFVDFFKDGLKLRHSSKYDLFIYLLVLMPPTCCSLLYPNIFLKALGFAGGFVDVLLFGLLPVSIVWVGRYVKKIEGPFRAPFGKPFLILILIFSCACLLIRK